MLGEVVDGLKIEFVFGSEAGVGTGEWVAEDVVGDLFGEFFYDAAYLGFVALDGANGMAEVV